MSDYTQTTIFAAKDDMPAGASEKKILGSEWDDEYAAISTAIASKYDSADLSDQSTAEAGSSDSVLVTPLRFKQHAAYRHLNRVSKDASNWTHYKVASPIAIGEITVFDPPNSYHTIIGSIALAAGLNAVRFRVSASGANNLLEWRLSLADFTVTPTAHVFYMNNYANTAVGGCQILPDDTTELFRYFDLDPDATTHADLYGGLVYMPSAGTMALVGGYVVGGGRPQPTVGTDTYLSCRAIS